MPGNNNLHDSSRNKQDEFYTNLQLVENELKHYRAHFKGKRVLCNCDASYESNSFKDFAVSFNSLGLKKLFAICYDGFPVAYTQLDLFGEGWEATRVSLPRSEVPHRGSGVSPLQAFTYSPVGDLLATHTYTNGTDCTTESYAYDMFGNRIATTDAHGNTIYRTYDPFGRVTAEWGATYPVRYTYDTQGRRTSMTTFRNTGGTQFIASADLGDTTTWTYDPPTGNCLSKTYADGSIVTYTYTPDNLLLRTTYASGRWKENVYDAQRRLRGVVYSSSDMDYELQLDEYGRTTYASNGVAQTCYALNDAGGATNEVREVGNAVDIITRMFDGADRLTGLAMPERDYEQFFTYSTNRLLSTISNSDAVVTYDYSDDLRDVGYAIAFANGGTIVRTMARDPFRRDQILSVTNTCGALSHGMAYSYDALSRPISRNADTFGYNERSEVSEALIDGNSESHEYDQIGNATIATFNFVTNIYTANKLNQYTSIFCASAPLREPTCDLDGNMTFDGVLSYSYDAENRLVSVSSNGITIVANEYDHKGRRIRKTTPLAVTTFLYDGWNLIHEHEVIGSVTNETFYYWGKDISGTLQGAGGIGGLLYLKRNGTIYIPHCDAYGNIVRYSDTVGNVVASYTYGAFGNILSASGSLADKFRFLFSTKYHDPEAGLFYYIGRYYSTTLMRWLTRDPIEEDGGENIYEFCRNAPLLYVDIQGEAAAMLIPVKILGRIVLEAAVEAAIITASAWIAMELTTQKKCSGCRPCDPPVGTEMYKIEYGHAHAGHDPHIHYFTVQQSPPFAGCGCFAPRTDLGGGDIPKAGTIPYRKPSGGGIFQ